MSNLVPEAASGRNLGPIPRNRPLPDIAEDSIASISRPIDQVGMSGIELAVRRTGPDGVTMRIPARADAAVSLDDANIKGIHMSRLFLRLQASLEDRELSPQLLEEAVDGFVQSHSAVSQRGMLTVRFEHLVRRASLLSNLSGWRNYPISVQASGAPGQISHLLEVRLTYSSTCPCSAALSRQLVQERFLETFDGRDRLTVEEVAAWLTTQQAIAALPHSQRSHADVCVRLAGNLANYPIDAVIEQCEQALRTPVQTAVRRADEQEFARLNGEHLMFCEDAARLLAEALDQLTSIDDYRVRVRHLESLHPHDAVAVITKRVPGGFTA